MGKNLPSHEWREPSQVTEGHGPELNCCISYRPTNIELLRNTQPLHFLSLLTKPLKPLTSRNRLSKSFDGKDLNLLEADLPKAHVLNKFKISNFVRKLNRATLLLLSLIMLSGLRIGPGKSRQ